ncbi:TPA: hypothetical protein DD449_02465 [Candidatus Berkelbacteria bacterium]|uniref:Uncharacterized protein n=1 Tax=Berkelbacteria bacterium GW2011_GWE1_39_12 TaxID=1618337 RepID=A0A0G4B4M2_9BACT|nr:MAG: hypothetical protein UT28_C0001G0137 [Berkelbacteria bacterium GW2011_GWE1_39_12]HBO60520.1 hypothetical protein [Candidatus Berkelbacteria bacterium]
MEQESKLKSKWMLIIIAVVVAIGIFLAWYFLMGPGKKAESSSTTATTSVADVEPMAGWSTYESVKHGYKINRPDTYVWELTGDGSVKFTKDGKVMADIYRNTGGTSADLDATVKLYTDATKGYMTDGVARSVTVAGTSGQQITGTFGKNGGIAKDNDGKKGSVVVFTKNDFTFIMDSYDLGDETASADFTQMLSEMSF